MSFNKGVEKETNPPQITNLEFGSITINGIIYTNDVIINDGEVSERKKGPSKSLRQQYGHTPLTPLEKIPWNCKKLVIGNGMSGQLPITDDFIKEAEKRGVELIILETPDAVKYFLEHFEKKVNAIFHITC